MMEGFYFGFAVLDFGLGAKVERKRGLTGGGNQRKNSVT
jgi:hypothetical protein